jgi:hypothetical protein
MPVRRQLIAFRSLFVLAAALACVLAIGAASASAAPASSDVLTICPAIGTSPVTTVTGEAACVQNDCASMAIAATGTDASCEATAQPMLLMSVATPTVVARADAPRNSTPVLAPAPAPGASWQSITMRALIAVGALALLIAGGLALITRGTPRPDGAPTARPAEAA